MLKLIDSSLSLADLEAEAAAGFGDMVKAVVDIEQKTMVINGELHVDEWFNRCQLA